MNESEAWQLMLAAEHNPVLASWAAVSLEHGVVRVSDISSMDAWAAYQELYNLDLVSSHDYNNESEHFFSKTPTTAEVQGVLSAILPVGSEHHYKEMNMSTNNDLDPFAPTNNAIARRSTPSNGQLQTRASQAADPFAIAPTQQSRHRDDDRALDMFAPSPGGLPCHDVDPGSNESTYGTVDGELFKPDVRCSGTRENPHPPEQIQMTGIEEHGSDGNRGLGSSLAMAVFEGVCRTCTMLHHATASKMQDPGAFR